MREKIRFLTTAGILAALYLVLTHAQNLLLPGSASWAIQFRISEALCVLALFSPAAIAGLSVGCLLFNLSFSFALPFDFLIGTAATLLATGGMYLFRKVRFFGYPLLSMLLPAICNGILVGWELTVCIGSGFLINALYVAIGEAAVLLTLGSILFKTIEKKGLSRFF